MGCPIHSGQVAMAKFFDTFIDPNRITFDVRGEVVCVVTASVWRDAVLSVEFPSGGSVRQPAHLHYQFVTSAAGQQQLEVLLFDIGSGIVFSVFC